RRRPVGADPCHELCTRRGLVMAGSVLALGLLGATLALGIGFAGVGGAAVEAQRVVAAADAAALAAADTAAGAVTGEPCARAERVAAASAVRLTHCSLDGLIATITVAHTFAGLPVRASARA